MSYQYHLSPSASINLWTSVICIGSFVWLIGYHTAVAKSRDRSRYFDWIESHAIHTITSQRKSSQFCQVWHCIVSPPSVRAHNNMKCVRRTPCCLSNVRSQRQIRFDQFLIHDENFQLRIIGFFTIIEIRNSIFHSKHFRIIRRKEFEKVFIWLMIKRKPRKNDLFPSLCTQMIKYGQITDCLAEDETELALKWLLPLAAFSRVVWGAPYSTD